MTTNEGENRPTQLSPKEFVREIRGLYARVAHDVLSPFVSLTSEEREAEDDALQKRMGGEYGERLRVKAEELLNSTPDLSPHLRVFIKTKLDADFDVGVLSQTETEPLPTHHKGLYDILTYDLPLVEELESNEEIIRQLEISCYTVSLALHRADKEAFEQRTKKSIPSLPDYFIRFYGNIIENREKNLGKWGSFIIGEV